MGTELENGHWTISTQLPVKFTLKNSKGVLDPNNQDLLEHGSTGPTRRRLVVIDRNICDLYLEATKKYFRENKTDVHIVAIDASENDKNLTVLIGLLGEIEKFGLLRRSEPIIAIGGGVLLDVVGQAAAMYRRGVPYIKVPTTYVGIIDASVGAKTAVNFESRRNRLGAYYPPVAAYLDKSFLRTLPKHELCAGMGESLKMAVIKDARLFDILESEGSRLIEAHLQDDTFADLVINLSVQGMKEELENNLWEKDLKRVVDFGHSFSPIIEMRSIEENEHIPLAHGEAVAIDVLYSCLLSKKRGLLSQSDVIRVFRVMKSLGLPTEHALFYDPLLVLEALNDTVKHRNGDQLLPLPTSIGKSTFINDLTYEEIKTGVEALKELNK